MQPPLSDLEPRLDLGKEGVTALDNFKIVFNSVFQGVVNIASVSLQIGYPTVASVPHSIINGFKNVAAVAVETNITFPQVEQLKAFLENPEAFASLAPAASEAAAAPAEETKEEKKEEEEEEESDDDMGFGLLD